MARAYNVRGTVSQRPREARPARTTQLYFRTCCKDLVGKGCSAALSGGCQGSFKCVRRPYPDMPLNMPNSGIRTQAVASIARPPGFDESSRDGRIVTAGICSPLQTFEPTTALPRRWSYRHGGWLTIGMARWVFNVRSM
ncbi:hypothetical protein KC321_g37 [Hortaea werneckii]|nr:hypothetical protein KC321_g37 [Hortaea werneckii]